MTNRGPGDAPGDAKGAKPKDTKAKAPGAPKPASKLAEAPKAAAKPAGDLPRSNVKSAKPGGDGKDGHDQPPSEPEKPALPSFKPGQVNQGFIRDAPVQVDRARAMGLAQSPGTREVIAGKLAERMGASFAELLPGARSRGAASLEEPDLRPPPFLSPFEAMKDIFLRARGRASPKTLELLTSPDLEDLVAVLGQIHGDTETLRKSEARIKASMFQKIRDAEAPLLAGFQDPRLSEPWRLFLEGWEIWVPDGKKGGVELFWEGEAEDDNGNQLEIVQSLRFVEGEVTIETQLGEDRDSVSFDGEGFFRFSRGGPAR
ncbi:MAG: hypothetical protein HYV07_28860 [Deltaproteobacteria bacterium]|nr:hypothetical protein [Deltaproteobacteria bacterium]